MKIAVLYNKPAERFKQHAEHIEAEDDTEISAKEVCEALTEKHITADLIPVTEKNIQSVVNGIDADLVFNLIEWTGVDAPLAIRTFDSMNARGLSYTGATLDNYMESCDKLRIKRLCVKYGLPTAQWQDFVTGDEPVESGLAYPMIVKVSLEHSSVGISVDAIVQNASELAALTKKRIIEFHQPVFAETFLTGREFQVTLIDTSDGLSVLPPAEIVYAKGTNVPLLTYESRWNEHHSDYSNSTVVLAQLGAGLAEHLDTMCRTAFTRMGFRDYARFDIRCDSNGNPFFLELNANPGLGDDPDYGMTVSYRAADMSFADFIWEIVGSAKRRLGKL